MKNKKNAAIITLYGNSNFGNKLQNYALQEVLKKYDFEVSNIRNISYLNNNNLSFLGYLKFKIKCILIRNTKYNIDKSEPIERTKKFIEFDKKINNTRYIFSFYEKWKTKKFDYFFVGSDQVWNPNYGGLSDFDLLTFTNKKKISFSASFGIDNVSDKYKKRLKKYLSDFYALSVREKEAKKIINEVLPNKRVDVLIDPTMMLNCFEWNNVMKKPLNFDLNQKYILCYFLGNMSDKYKVMIDEYALKNNYKIIDISNQNSLFYNIGPSEFLYLEKYAEVIFTDSFHSCVFSILYKKQFIVFNRHGKYDNMNSRIKTLLTTFNLEKQLYTGKKNISNMLKIDYVEIDKILKKEKNKVKEFLESIIGDSNE